MVERDDRTKQVGCVGAEARRRSVGGGMAAGHAGTHAAGCVESAGVWCARLTVCCACLTALPSSPLHPHVQLTFSLVHRLAKPSSKAGAMWVGLLKEGPDGLFRCAGRRTESRLLRSTGSSAARACLACL